MIYLALVGSVVLVFLAAVHLLWALGYWWPIPEETALARAVVGAKGITRMPGAVPTSLVVVALLFAAAWPWFPAGGFKAFGLYVIALVFQVRCVLAFAPFWKRATPEMPFRRYDETYFGPLCGVLGVIYFLLASAARA